MNSKQPRLQWVLTVKELRETLRDRRTIITLLAMPLLLYPIIGLLFRTMSLRHQQAGEQHYQIFMENEEEYEWFKAVVDDYFTLRRKKLAEAKVHFDQPVFEYVYTNADSPARFEDVLSRQEADLGVKVHFHSKKNLHEKKNSDPIIAIRVYQTEGSPRSMEAGRLVEQALTVMKLETVTEILQKQISNFPSPWESSITMVTPQKSGSPFLGMIPLLIMLMTVTGGVYPAIDLTAGERERDTLETLIALPVSTFRILLAKYFAILVVTLLTCIMNLLAMSVTVFSLQLEQSLFGESGITLMLIVKMFIIQTVFAMFVSSVLLLVTSTARSFKEAQAYLVPILLLAMVPGFSILLPGWNLTGINIIIPMINMLLLARDVAEDQVRILPMIVTLLTTTFYTLFVLSFAGKVFGKDAFATGSRAMWSDLWKRPETASDYPETTLVFQVLGVLFPVYFAASGSLSRMHHLPPAITLIISALLTICLFVVIPVIFLGYQKIKYASTFGFRKIHPAWLPLFLLTGLSTWPVIYELMILLHQQLSHRLFNEDQMLKVKEILESWKLVPVPLIVLCLGIVPGICEELFFRGFCFSGLRTRMNATLTILVTSLIFASFHLLLSGGASPERFVPSLLMGIFLGGIRSRSGSVWPSMIVHVIHNSSLLIIAAASSSLQFMFGDIADQSHLPSSWLISAGVVLVISTTLLYLQPTVSRRTAT